MDNQQEQVLDSSREQKQPVTAPHTPAITAITFETVTSGIKAAIAPAKVLIPLIHANPFATVLTLTHSTFDAYFV